MSNPSGVWRTVARVIGTCQGDSVACCVRPSKRLPGWQRRPHNSNRLHHLHDSTTLSILRRCTCTSGGAPTLPIGQDRGMQGAQTAHAKRSSQVRHRRAKQVLANGVLTVCCISKMPSDCPIVDQGKRMQTIRPVRDRTTTDGQTVNSYCKAALAR